MVPAPHVGGRLRLLSAALAAADRGWPVFPLFPGSKRPAIAGWERHATTETAVLETWWTSAPYNIGIACGPAGLLVVDLDSPGEPSLAGGHLLPATYTVSTPGGQHRYFTVDPSGPGRSTVSQAVAGPSAPVPQRC